MAHVPGRCGDPDVQHHNVPFGRVVGHGIGPVSLLTVLHTEVPHLKLIPLIAVLLFHINVFGKIHLKGLARGTYRFLDQGEIRKLTN